MVKITDRFYINATTNCYILQEKTTIKDEKSKNFGQEVFKDLGYYTTVESCLRGFFKKTIREYVSKEDINSIYELQKQIKETEEFLNSLKIET